MLMLLGLKALYPLLLVVVVVLLLLVVLPLALGAEV
jgi:hypothetical protein